MRGTLGSDAGCGNNRVEVISNGISVAIGFCATAEPADASQINIGRGNTQKAEDARRFAEAMAEV